MVEKFVEVKKLVVLLVELVVNLLVFVPYTVIVPKAVIVFRPVS